MKHWLDLSGSRSLLDLHDKLKQSRPTRGDWILGFGWDESLWDEPFGPQLEILDKLFPDHPVALSRIDGHCLWINSEAFRRAGLSIDGPFPEIDGGRIERDGSGKFTGLLIDNAKLIVERHIPEPTRPEMKHYLLEGMRLFLDKGFSHIRDVGGCLTHWELASDLEKTEDLQFFCEMFFNLESFGQLDERIREILNHRNEPRRQLRVAGLKMFLDGSLGSEGAYLSRAYPSGKHGLLLYEPETLKEVFTRCWKNNIPVAVHTLGDEAVHQAVVAATQLRDRGITGALHLEHCEVVRSETISLMKGLEIRCHLQPSHFLSDQRWLKEKLGDLYTSSFPWRRLIEAGIPVSFGSDSPIELPSLMRTQKAIETAANHGIIPPPVSFWNFHSHHDGTWGSQCVTKLMDDGSVNLTMSLER